MPFQETKDGSTHFIGDSCTPPHVILSVKEEILTKIDVDTYVDTFYFRADWDSQDEVKEYLIGLLDRYAMAVVEASVPPEDRGYPLPEDFYFEKSKTQCATDAYGACREATLAKAREILGQ